MKKETVERIRKFTKDREWDKYHTPNALAKTIAIESTELLECFQWNENGKIDKIKEELADVIVNCQNLLDRLRAKNSSSIAIILIKLLLINLDWYCLIYIV